MNNVIEFRIQNGTLSGHEVINTSDTFGDKGPAQTRYLGSEFLDDHADLTLALQNGFGLRTAVAPGEWPEPHERVVPGGEDFECLGHESLSGPIGSTEYCDGSCQRYRARWGHD